MTPRIPPPAPGAPAAAAPAAAAPATAGRALQLARVGYGTALVLAPGVAIFLATGHLPGRGARRVARLLGARHLVQAALTAVAPLPEVFTMGAQADAVHAASMVLLATVDRPARKIALTDALAEAIFAATGWGWARRLGARASRGGGENTALSYGRAAGTRPPAAATGARPPPGSPPGRRRCP